MKIFLTIVVGICAGLVGVNTAIHLVFSQLLEARFPNANFEGFVTAMSQCENHSLLFFMLSFIGGAIFSSYFLGKQPKPKYIAGILTGLATGALVGAVSGLIYFYNVYT